MRDLHSNVGIAHAISAQTVTSGGGAVNSGDVDLQGFGSAEIVLNIGANGGDTLNGTNYFEVLIEHADDDGTGAAGAYAAVEADDVIGVTPASGVVVTIDDAAEDELSYNVGYIGDKRFVKVTITPNGTLTNGNPMSCDIVKGNPKLSPVA